MLTPKLISATVLLFAHFTCLFATSELSLESAMALSKDQNKSIIVNYTADWCLPCQVFKENVLSDSEVDFLLTEAFIVLNADYAKSQNRELIDTYNVQCLPTLHVLDSDGDILLELSGNRSKSSFLEAILPFAKSKHLKDYKSTDALVTNDSVSKNNTKKFLKSDFLVIQAGAFQSLDNARNQVNRISKLVSDEIIILEGQSKTKLYYVHIGKYNFESEYKNTVNTLKQYSIDYFIKRNKI